MKMPRKIVQIPGGGLGLESKEEAEARVVYDKKTSKIAAFLVPYVFLILGTLVTIKDMVSEGIINSGVDKFFLGYFHLIYELPRDFFYGLASEVTVNIVFIGVVLAGIAGYEYLGILRFTTKIIYFGMAIPWFIWVLFKFFG